MTTTTMTTERIEEVKKSLRRATVFSMTNRELECHCGNALIAIETLQRKLLEVTRPKQEDTCTKTKT